MTEIDKIKQLLIDRNIQIVAKGAGVSPGQIYKLVNGTVTKPSYDVITKLKLYLNI